VPLLECFLFLADPYPIEIEIDRMRHIRLHERVNDLPDANYATLKYFLGHLHRYVRSIVRSTELIAALR
jgi:hypothetical protein